MLPKKYVILELIPDNSQKEVGHIVQLQALLIENNMIIDRFDYRRDYSLINNNDLINMISYDNEMFTYTKKDILVFFKKWIKKYPLLYINNEYTVNYLSELKNEKIDIFKLLDLEVNFDVFNNLIKKYNLEPSNHFVDLIYEAIITK